MSYRQRMNKCNTCSKKDIMAPTYKDGEYVCKVCGRIFQRKDRLDEHKRKHLPDSGYKCTICLKSLTTRTNLMRHRKVVHNTCTLCIKLKETMIDQQFSYHLLKTQLMINRQNVEIKFLLLIKTRKPQLAWS